MKDKSLIRNLKKTQKSQRENKVILGTGSCLELSSSKNCERKIKEIDLKKPMSSIGNIIEKSLSKAAMF